MYPSFKFNNLYLRIISFKYCKNKCTYYCEINNYIQEKNLRNINSKNERIYYNLCLQQCIDIK